LRLRLDLHVHTLHSFDCRITIDELLKRCREKELDGFAITDHGTIDGVPEALEKKGNLVVIPGIEVSTGAADVLALNIQEPVSAGLGLAETVEKIHEQGAVTVLAHPHSLFRPVPKDREIIEAKLDALEVANASHLPFKLMQRRNEALAERLKLPATGGSDSHFLETLGRAYTIIETDSKEIDEVVSSIRRGRTEAAGKGVSILEKLRRFGL